jgi:hypothetical protein
MRIDAEGMTFEQAAARETAVQVELGADEGVAPGPSGRR